MDNMVVLMLMANQLKQLAKDYGLFIFSATQVNSVGMLEDGSFKDEQSIRGSKAVSDKADLSYVMTEVTDKVWNSLVGNFRKSVREGVVDSNYIEDNNLRPTHVIDVYKNRRGRYKNIRIWIKLDLGTGYRKDLFMTTANNQPIKIIDNTLYETYSRVFDWRAMLEKGIN